MRFATGLGLVGLGIVAVLALPACEQPPAAPKTQDCAGLDCYRVTTGQLGVAASHDGGRTFTTVRVRRRL